MTLAGGRAAAIGAALALLVLLAGCSPQRDATPLPTRQTTIDPVTKKLEAAGVQAGKRREEMEAATK
jgi:hypothetical protein